MNEKKRSPPRLQKPAQRPWSEPPIELEAADLLSARPSPQQASPQQAKALDLSIDFDAPAAPFLEAPRPSWSNLELFNRTSKVLTAPLLPNRPKSEGPRTLAGELSVHVGNIVRANRTWLAALAIMLMGASASWAVLPLARGGKVEEAISAQKEESRIAEPAPAPLPSVPTVIAAPRTREPETRESRTTPGKPGKARSARFEVEPRTIVQPTTAQSTASPAPPSTQPEPPLQAPRERPQVAPPSFFDFDVAGEFDRNAAMQALRQAGDTARPCFAGGTPDGARVAVTFARNGSVSAVAVEGPLTGTPSGSCVAAKFRGLHVPPFRGSSVTVRKTITS